MSSFRVAVPKHTLPKGYRVSCTWLELAPCAGVATEVGRGTPEP